jgi:hypothetical protein
MSKNPYLLLIVTIMSLSVVGDMIGYAFGTAGVVIYLLGILGLAAAAVLWKDWHCMYRDERALFVVAAVACFVGGILTYLAYLLA